MTPPASTEPMYQVTKEELIKFFDAWMFSTKDPRELETQMATIRARDPVQQAPAKHYIRSDVLAFAEAMETVLRKNDYKGGWYEMSVGEILDRIDDELKEAHEAWDAVKKQKDYYKVSDELIDVANFCMMFWERMHVDAIPIHSKERDAALIAQEREKWEMERAQASTGLPEGYHSSVFEFKRAGRLMFQEDPKPGQDAQEIKTIGWIEFNERLYKEPYVTHLKNKAAQAREDVLKEFAWMKPACFGRHEAACDTKCAWIMRKRCVEFLRSEVKRK